MQTLIPAETRSVLDNIRWETFVDLSEQRRGSVPRMTFDEGVLELMSPGRLHENIGRLLGRLVETYTEVHNIEIVSVASTTYKRKDLQRAFEPDESYYIEHADQIRHKADVDLLIDPPPDLVIEVEITSSAIAKMKLFASMDIPEVWRHDGDRLAMYRLVNGVYQQQESSSGIPGLSTAMITAVLNQRFEVGETALIRTFREQLTG